MSRYNCWLGTVSSMCMLARRQSSKHAHRSWEQMVDPHDAGRMEKKKKKKMLLVSVNLAPSSSASGAGRHETTSKYDDGIVSSQIFKYWKAFGFTWVTVLMKRKIMLKIKVIFEEFSKSSLEVKHIPNTEDISVKIEHYQVFLWTPKYVFECFEMMSFGWKDIKKEKHRHHPPLFGHGLTLSYIDSLKTRSQLIPTTLTTNGWLVTGVPQSSDTKQPLTGTLHRPPDIPQAQTSLPPPFLPHSPPAYPAPPQPSTSLSFHSTTIVPSFSDILISPKTNGSRIFLSLLRPLPLLSPIFSLSLSLLHSGADERQALSRQWHSKTSGLGSSVSGYSTLLGAISLSKVWPAYSPTENPQISYYTRHTEGRHTAALQGCNECVYVCGRWIQIETSEYKKTWRYGGERKTHAWACLFMSERESELVWEAACVLEIYEQWVSRSLGRIFRKFPHREAKCVARRQTPLTNNSP